MNDRSPSGPFAPHDTSQDASYPGYAPFEDSQMYMATTEQPYGSDATQLDAYGNATYGQPPEQVAAYDTSPYDTSAYEASSYDASVYDTSTGYESDPLFGTMPGQEQHAANSAHPSDTYDGAAYGTGGYDTGGYGTGGYDTGSFDTNGYGTIVHGSEGYATGGVDQYGSTYQHGVHETTYAVDPLTGDEYGVQPPDATWASGAYPTVTGEPPHIPAQTDHYWATDATADTNQWGATSYSPDGSDNWPHGTESYSAAEGYDDRVPYDTGDWDTAEQTAYGHDELAGFGNGAAYASATTAGTGTFNLDEQPYDEQPLNPPHLGEQELISQRLAEQHLPDEALAERTLVGLAGHEQGPDTTEFPTPVGSSAHSDGLDAPTPDTTLAGDRHVNDTHVNDWDVNDPGPEGSSAGLHDDAPDESPLTSPTHPVSRGRRRATKPRRSALLTVAVPSVAVMGVAGIAAASVGNIGEQQNEKVGQAAPDPTSVKPSTANNKLDTQLDGVSADAGDFAGRASRTQERLDLKERQEAERKRKEAEAARKEAERPKFALPVDQPGLSAYYGQSGVNWLSLHTGIDFPVSYGVPVKAATDGYVSTKFDISYGNMMIVTAPDGTETWYCHLSSSKIRSGHVKAGDTIGYAGSSGKSTGPHLHFEVRPGGGSAIDPLAWFRGKGLDPT